jgi:hypothetical protein
MRPISITVPKQFPLESEQWADAECQSNFMGLLSDLTQQGDDGFELVSVVASNGWLMFFFKKPLSS